MKKIEYFELFFNSLEQCKRYLRKRNQWKQQQNVGEAYSENPGFHCGYNGLGMLKWRIRMCFQPSGSLLF